MKKIILIVLCLFVLIGCNEEENKTAIDKTVHENIKPVEQVVGEDSYSGIWLYGDEDLSILYLFDDGRFYSNDPKMFGDDSAYLGQAVNGLWTFEDYNANILIDDKTITLSLEDDFLLVEDKTFKKFDSTLHKGKDNFNGEWQRTEVHRSEGGYLEIESHDKYLTFDAELLAGGHTGVLTGIAHFISDNEATYIHHRKSGELETVNFKLIEGDLEVTCTNGIQNEFGMGVFIDGHYTLDEPHYSNENIMIDTFVTEDRIATMKALIGEENFSFLEFVMDYGYASENQSLTHSGFVMGLGQGVNFIMTEEDDIYYHAFGQNEKELYYTNDPDSKGLIHPDLMVQIKDLSNLEFKYNDGFEVKDISDYVYIKGSYSPPASWMGDVLKWERGNSEYVEVIVNGDIRNFKIVSLDFDDNFNLVYGDSLYELDKLSHERFVMDTYHPEGIPSEAIIFDDLYGHTYTYTISERTLRGETFDLNEALIPLAYDKHCRLIYNYEEALIEVPVLQSFGESLEAFVANGWRLLDQVQLDFNSDGINDIVGVIEKDDQEISEYPRILFALKGQPNGYKLDFQDINLVRHAGEGGVFGDPYMPLTTEGKDFEINTYGGSAWKWSERSQFTHIDGTWFLKEKEDTYGYGPSITDYTFDDYDKGYSIRKHYNSDFESMEHADIDKVDLSFEVKLNEMPSLQAYSESWWLAPDRLGKLHFKDLYTYDGISQLSRQEIQSVINESSNIVEMTDKYLIFRSRNTDSTKEHYLLYDRRFRDVSVFMEVETIGSQYSIIDDMKLDGDSLYYVKNQIEINGDNTYIKEASINQLILGETPKELVTFENTDIDGDYPYFSLYIEPINGEIICRLHTNNHVKYYKIKGSTADYLGETTY